MPLVWMYMFIYIYVYVYDVSVCVCVYEHEIVFTLYDPYSVTRTMEHRLENWLSIT